MEELLENLLFSALFPKVDRWRRANRLDLPDPPDDVLRVFCRVEIRLQQRYGTVALQQMAEVARMRRIADPVRHKLMTMSDHNAWVLLTRTAFWSPSTDRPN